MLYVILVVLVVAVLYLLSTLGKHKKNEAALAESQKRAAESVKAAEAAIKAKDAELVAMQSEVARFAPFKDIVDISAELERRKAEAQHMIAQAKAKIDAMAAQGLKDHQFLTERITQLQAEVAGAEQTLVGLKNALEGYGDRYVVPTAMYLDDIAERMAYTEPSKNLQDLRQRIKAIVASGKAGKSDYAEEGRNKIAVRLVVDAFNGRAVDIISQIKRDNIGTLEQKLKDAFSLVNDDGKPFGNAQITTEYLALKLEELRLAARLYQLDEQQKAEQRAIREQLREEEKARKEIEKAQADAEKEELALRKAMEKLQGQLDKARADDRAEFEQKLVELQQKLTDAEERGRRALSMAQQTRRGHVYVISNIGSLGESVYKIGMTRRLEPADRVRELGDASVPFPFDIHAMIFTEDAPTLERELHRRFLDGQVNKINPRKEFFKVGLADIRKAVEELGLQATWTMSAMAAEYRESIAIADKLAADPAYRAAWVSDQQAKDPVGPLEIIEDEAT